MRLSLSRLSSTLSKKSTLFAPILNTASCAASTADSMSESLTASTTVAMGVTRSLNFLSFLSSANAAPTYMPTLAPSPIGWTENSAMTRYPLFRVMSDWKRAWDIRVRIDVSGHAQSHFMGDATCFLPLFTADVSESFQPTGRRYQDRFSEPICPHLSYTLPMEKTMMQQTTSAYPKTASVLALIGGIIIVLGGALFIFVSAFVLPNINYVNITTPTGLSSAAIPALVSGVVGVMGAFGLVSGAVVLMSAVLLLAKVGQPRTWGILVLVFSILSFVGLGGFIVGAVLGMVGGILVLRWKPPTK
jgi:hypothetical protein